MRKIIFICICFGVLSCQKNVHFNEIEKSFLEMYNVGDTLIFESETGLKDTIAILDKDIRYAQWNPFAHGIEYKTLFGEVYYGSNKKLYMNEPYPYTLLSISKNRPDTSFFYISIRGASIFRRFSTSTYNYFDKFKIDDSTYLFQSEIARENKVRIDYIYWNIKYGITQYIGSDSIAWKRINIPK